MNFHLKRYYFFVTFGFNVIFIFIFFNQIPENAKKKLQYMAKIGIKNNKKITKKIINNKKLKNKKFKKKKIKMHLGFVTYQVLALAPRKTIVSRTLDF